MPYLLESALGLVLLCPAITPGWTLTAGYVRYLRDATRDFFEPNTMLGQEILPHTLEVW
ncbi:MAG: hypothetical protein AB1664_13180 [Thermodesulfobacteriota bacterium]